MSAETVVSTNMADVYRLLGRFLSYPGAEFDEMCLLSKALVALVYPEGASQLAAFETGVEDLEEGALEELYVATFDVNAACCLDVGYAVFGEDYKRGQCMAELKCLHQKYDIDCGSELPDFLPNVLKLLPKLPYGDAAELTRTIVEPAIEKMLSGFGETVNPYRYLLLLVQCILRRDYLAH